MRSHHRTLKGNPHTRQRASKTLFTLPPGEPGSQGGEGGRQNKPTPHK